VSDRPALALELSQRTASIAVRRHDGTVIGRELGAGRDAAEGVLAVADSLLRDLDMTPRALRLIAVSVGPGGFTGVRIAVAAAQAIAEASGAAAIGVPSAAVAIESTLRDDDAKSALSILAVKRRDGITDGWVTRLDRDDGVWSTTDGGRLVVLERLDLTGIDVVVAESDQIGASARIAAFGASGRLVEPRFDAVACMHLADRALRGGATGAAQDLRAVYPRRPEAVELWAAREVQSENG